MNKYEEIREELKKMLEVIIEEEYNEVLKEAQSGNFTLKEGVNYDQLKASIISSILK